MNNSQLKNEEKFHKFIAIILCIWAYVGTIINCVKVGSVFSLFPAYLSISQMALYILNAAALILILEKHAIIGVWMAFSIQALMVVLWGIYNVNLVGDVLIESIISILLLSLLLCIRKERVSGWRVLLNKNKNEK